MTRGSSGAKIALDRVLPPVRFSSSFGQTDPMVVPTYSAQTDLSTGLTWLKNREKETQPQTTPKTKSDELWEKSLIAAGMQPKTKPIEEKQELKPFTKGDISEIKQYPTETDFARVLAALQKLPRHEPDKVNKLLDEVNQAYILPNGVTEDLRRYGYAAGIHALPSWVSKYGDDFIQFATEASMIVAGVKAPKYADLASKGIKQGVGKVAQETQERLQYLGEQVANPETRQAGFLRLGGEGMEPKGVSEPLVGEGRFVEPPKVTAKPSPQSTRDKLITQATKKGKKIEDAPNLTMPRPYEEVNEKLLRMVREGWPTKYQQVEAKLAQKAELRQRVAAYTNVRAGAQTEAEAQRSIGLLKSSYTKAKLNIPKDLQWTQDDVDQLFRQIGAAEIKPLEIPNTEQALYKVLSGQMPTLRERGLLEQVFGVDMVQAISKNRSLGSRAWEEFLSAANLPRALLASFDLSAPLRQGVTLAPGHMRQWTSAFGPMLKALASEKYATELDTLMRTSEMGKLADAVGLDLTKWGGSTTTLIKREEAFMSRLANRIPGVRMSERAYVTYLNKLRYDVFTNEASKFLAAGKTLEKNFNDFENLAKFINIATGRGDLGKFTEYSPLLNATFFSPRFAVSRFELPIIGIKGFIQSPALRFTVAKDLISFVGTGITALTLIDLSGAAKVELDPRSSDFGKIRIGDTRIDFWGGYQPVARYTAQLMTERRKNTATGAIMPANRLDIVGRFLESKLSPAAGFTHDVLYGKTFVGQEMSLSGGNVATQAKQRLAPMFIQDMWDAIKTQGTFKGTSLGVWGGLGASVQTYQETPSDNAENGYAPPPKSPRRRRWTPGFIP